jgi:hypothetical protein
MQDQNAVSREIALAREILNTMPTVKANRIPIRSKSADLIEYRDDYIHVTGSKDTQVLHIEIFPPLTEARSNPIVYVDDNGRCYRNHGERIYFIVYAEKLLGKTDITRLYRYGEEKAEKIRSLIS